MEPKAQLWQIKKKLFQYCSAETTRFYLKQPMQHYQRWEGWGLQQLRKQVQLIFRDSQLCIRSTYTLVYCSPSKGHSLVHKADHLI